MAKNTIDKDSALLYRLELLVLFTIQNIDFIKRAYML